MASYSLLLNILCEYSFSKNSKQMWVVQNTLGYQVS